MEELTLPLWADVRADLDGLRVVAESVGGGGELTALAVAPDLVSVVAPERNRPPVGVPVDTDPARFVPYEAVLLVVFPDGRRSSAEIRGATAYAPVVERLPDGGFLIAGGSCELRPRRQHAPDGELFMPYGDDYEAELNGLRYDAAGTLLGRCCLGTGIEHVQVSPRGHVWVGYSDMGIFGTSGWGETGGPRPLGRSGLVRFALDGTVRWRYQEPEGLPNMAGYIADCEALTLAGDDGETAFVCYHTEFPLARCSADGSVRVWRTGGGVWGARAVAVAGEAAYVVFDRYGGPQRVLRGVIDEHSVQLRDERVRTLTLVDTTPLPRAGVRGRGPRLAALVDGVWYGRDVADSAVL